ncbi:hypothetical protein FGG08_006697 [Glutinoglossum americanum]|uniref:Uncharacterized protein n=1 Tax=Glutinoglossum americanum TaxID=1670608 RepID=A0A9P8L0P7_9PEZI|nr:hypothetical protein FGG08_006697 [Glutinoglossum americanum]
MNLIAKATRCRGRYAYRHYYGSPLRSSSLLFLSYILPRSSFSQVMEPSSSSTPTTTATTATSTTTSSSIPTTPATTLPAIPTPLDDPPFAMFTTTKPASDHDHNRDNSLVNLYFLLLFLFAALVALIYYILRRRRREKSARSQRRRHIALARDLAAWPGMSRARTLGGRRGPAYALGRSTGGRSLEEGLDARVEPPPPYEHPPPAFSPGDFSNTPPRLRERLSRSAEDSLLPPPPLPPPPTGTRPRRNTPSYPPTYHDRRRTSSSESDTFLPLAAHGLVTIPARTYTMRRSRELPPPGYEEVLTPLSR